MSGNPDEITAIGPDELDPPGKLPFSIVHALNSAGITTYTQLSNYSPEAIMLIPGMNRLALGRIEAELKRRNLSLGPLGVVPNQKAPPPNAGFTPQQLRDFAQPRNHLTPAPEQATLRDQMAMAALTGIMSNLDRPDLLKGGYREVNIREVCVDAYALADGMLKARKGV